MKRAELAWAAGLIDGEGCVFISRRSPQAAARAKSPNYYAAVKVAMCHKGTILRLRELFGVGSLHLDVKHKATEKGWSDYHVWLCQQRESARVLTAILPYSVTKREEIKIALRFLALPLAKRGGNGGSAKVPARTEAQRDKLWHKMRELKSLKGGRK